MAAAALEEVDLGPWLAGGGGGGAAAAGGARGLREHGALLVRDPRCSAGDNGAFLDLLERYWAQPAAAKLEDERPELLHQVGVLPAGTEVPRPCREALAAQTPGNRAAQPLGPDPKWRFHWRLGERPAQTRFPALNAVPVVPRAFAGEWAQTLDGWGNKMLAAVAAVAELAETGFDLAPGTFVKRLAQAPHLLAPTGSDLAEHGKVGTVFAGYHYDLNFLTIHGRSRFPGLNIWLRDGTKMGVEVPEGCLLVQAGKQMEWMTGGQVLAGYHEVVCGEATVAAAESARAAGRPLWRVSSTVFSHLASDSVLEPQGSFGTPESRARYPTMAVGEQVRRELEDRKARRDEYRAESARPA